MLTLSNWREGDSEAFACCSPHCHLLRICILFSGTGHLEERVGIAHCYLGGQEPVFRTSTSVTQKLISASGFQLGIMNMVRDHSKRIRNSQETRFYWIGKWKFENLENSGKDGEVKGQCSFLQLGKMEAHRNDILKKKKRVFILVALTGLHIQEKKLEILLQLKQQET